MLFSLQKIRISIWSALLVSTTLLIQAQTPSDSVLQVATLDKVVEYALAHQPAVQQAQVDEEIAEKVIKGKLADWYPQINFEYNYQRVIDKQTAVFGGQNVRLGVFNISALQLNATQNIFNRDALLASSSASKVRILASQNTNRAKIDVVVDITVDEQGNVADAKASWGHPLLQSAAVQAARQAKFRPTLLQGVPVTVKGQLLYNFVVQ